MNNGYNNLTNGIRIFVSRPFTLVITLIVAVVITVASFMLLLFPVMAGYYHAVAHSRRETQFIDLNSLFVAIGMLFQGIKRYFFGSYVLGLFGLTPALALSVAPVLPFYDGAQSSLWWLLLQILLIPAYFLAGTIVLYGFPSLIQTGRGFDSLGFSIRAGAKSFFKVLLLGFLLLFPITGAVIHLLMVFSYPIITAWGVAQLVEE